MLEKHIAAKNSRKFDFEKLLKLKNNKFTDYCGPIHS